MKSETESLKQELVAATRGTNTHWLDSL